MPKKDINQIAFDVVQRATGQVTATPETAKAAAGRKGGLKGGSARASALTQDQRSEIAQKAAKARWRKPQIR